MSQEDTTPLKVYLDDERPTPDTWVSAHWPCEVIEHIEAGNVTHISLDHDLGDDDKGTGYDVLTWLEKRTAEDGFAPPIMQVHSANSAARKRMQAAIKAIEEQDARNQAAFAQVCEHLIKQGCKSLHIGDDGGEQCAYRGENDTKCAIGCLIPDDEYQPILEGNGISRLLKLDSVPSLARLSSYLLERLQFIHDHSDVSKWKTALRQEATKRGYAMPACLVDDDE